MGKPGEDVYWPIVTKAGGKLRTRRLSRPPGALPSCPPQIDEAPLQRVAEWADRNAPLSLKTGEDEWGRERPESFRGAQNEYDPSMPTHGLDRIRHQNHMPAKKR